MWEPAAEFDPLFAPAWEWIIHSGFVYSSSIDPTIGGERIVRIKSRANPSFTVSAHPHKGVVLMPLIGTDAHQLWLVDDSREADRGFALINKASGRALQHNAPNEQVSLVDYDPTEANERILWTLGPDAGQGFYALRGAGDMPLFLDVLEEDMAEGAPIVACDWKGGLHQMWAFQPMGLQFTIRSRISAAHALTAGPNRIKSPEVEMTPLDEANPLQLWTLDTHFDQSVTIRNVGCGLTLRGPPEEGAHVRLGDAGHARVFSMWLLGKEEGECYFGIRAVYNMDLCLDAIEGKVREGCGVIVYRSKLQDGWSILDVYDTRQNQMWGFFPKGEGRPVKPL